MDTTQQGFGLQELYRPVDGNAEVDIVAVHGLNGNAMMTWTAHPENICWLNHPYYLPRYMRNARVLVWGYNANVSSTTGPTSSNRILQHAQTPVHQLEADRDLEDARRDLDFSLPLIGRHHSEEGNSLLWEPDIPKISTYSLNLHKYLCDPLFRPATPWVQQGSPLRKPAEVVRLAIPSNVAYLGDDLVDALKEQSEILQNINDQFAPLMAEFWV